jgi:integrase
MIQNELPASITPTSRRLTASDFQRLADVPPEIEWFANIDNPSTRRAYENAINDFMRFNRARLLRRAGLCDLAHSLRATAATNALDHQAYIAKVQEWLGHANIATTRIYDHRKTRSEDSPFKVIY